MPTCSVQLPPATPRPRINRQRLAILALGLVIACLGVPDRVHAQSSPPATAEAPSERAKRDADKVYELIRMHADKPRKATAVTTPATTSQPLPQASVLTPQPGNGASAVLTAAVAAPSESAARRVMQADSAAKIVLPPPALTVSPAAPALDTTLAMQQLASSASTLGDPVKSAAALLPAANVLVLVSGVDPTFPSHLIRRLGQGSVLVNFDVQPDGSVGSTAIAKSSHSGLNEAARAAVAAWRFKSVSAVTVGVTESRFE